MTHTKIGQPKEHFYPNAAAFAAAPDQKQAHPKKQVFSLETTPPLRSRPREGEREPKARTFCPSIADFVKSEFGLFLVPGLVSVRSYSVFHDTVLIDLESPPCRAFANLHV